VRKSLPAGSDGDWRHPRRAVLFHLGVFRHERAKLEAAGAAAKSKCPTRARSTIGGDRDALLEAKPPIRALIRIQLEPGRGRARLGKGVKGFSRGDSSPWCTSNSRPTPATTRTSCAGDHAARAPRRDTAYGHLYVRGEQPRDARWASPCDSEAFRAPRRAMGSRECFRGLRRRHLPPAIGIVEPAHAGHRVGVPQGERWQRLNVPERSPHSRRHSATPSGKWRVLQRTAKSMAWTPCDLYPPASAQSNRCSQPVSLAIISRPTAISSIRPSPYALRHRRSEKSRAWKSSGGCRGALRSVTGTPCASSTTAVARSQGGASATGRGKASCGTVGVVEKAHRRSPQRNELTAHAPTTSAGARRSTTAGRRSGGRPTGSRIGQSRDCRP